MTEPAAARVLVVTDSDSYVKWGAALAGQLPRDWPRRLVVTRGNALPSRRQVDEAVEGTRFEGDRVELVGAEELTGILRRWEPDVVLAAARGHTVQATVALVDNAPRRPVLVSGLAGIAVPVLPFGLGFRRSVDVFVVHSRRELAAFAAASARLGIEHDFRLATLPFVDPRRAQANDAAPAVGEGALPVADRRLAVGAGRSAILVGGAAGGVVEETGRDRIVFAAQAQVPANRRDRVLVVDRLVATALAHPHLTVVLKVRARAGETQTHHEQVPYETLLADADRAGRVPPNLVLESGSMRAQLRRAAGFVTVSSTALLEAVAADVPVLALSDFGVGAAQINEVLRGSGLLGPSTDLVAGRFRRPDPAWLADNYFHDPAEDTWVGRVRELVEQRRRAGLPPYPEQPGGLANRVRAELYRDLAFSARSGHGRDRVERQVLRVISLALRLRAHVQGSLASVGRGPGRGSVR